MVQGGQSSSASRVPGSGVLTEGLDTFLYGDVFTVMINKSLRNHGCLLHGVRSPLRLINMWQEDSLYWDPKRLLPIPVKGFILQWIQNDAMGCPPKGAVDASESRDGDLVSLKICTSDDSLMNSRLLEKAACLAHSLLVFIVALAQSFLGMPKLLVLWRVMFTLCHCMSKVNT